jgi:hypothetical protein
LETLKNFQNSGLSREELTPDLLKFQQDWETMGNEIEPEFGRLDTIPGIDNHGKKFFEDFQKIIEPISQEGEKIMMMLGLGEPQTPQHGTPPPPQRKNIERQRLEEFTELYGINSIDELENSKDLIINKIENKLHNILEKLRSFKNMPRGEYECELIKINDYMDIFDNEGQYEFERIKSLPGGFEYYETFQREMLSHFGPIFDEIDPLVKTLSAPSNIPQGSYPPPQNSYPPPQPKGNVERQKLEELEIFYGINSLEQLESSQELIIESLENGVKKDIEKLKSFKNKPREEYMPEYIELKDYLKIFDNEFQLELDRLNGLPGGKASLEKLQIEMENRFGSLLDEMEQLLEELK